MKKIFFLVFAIIIIYFLYYIGSIFINTSDDLILENDVGINESSDIALINKIEIVSIGARKTYFTIRSTDFKGIEYQVLIKAPFQLKNIDKIGFQLQYPLEISGIIGNSASGIQYGISEIKQEKENKYYQFESVDANNNLSDNDLEDLINNKSKIFLEIYYDNQLFRTINQGEN